MKKLAFFAAAMTLSASAFAGFPGSIIDQRGYANCEDMVNQESFEGVMLDRNFIVKRNAEGRTYYLNGSVWQNEERELLTATCTTTKNGRDVLDFDATVGTNITIDEVASR